MQKEQEIQKIVQLLNEGAIILYPTDTVWGIGCDALNKDAVQRLFKIKQRMEDKSVIVLIDSVDRLGDFVPNKSTELFNLLINAKEPQTVVFPVVENLPTGVVNQNGSGAFRIPKHEFCLKLLKAFKKPLVSTSANVSGEKTPLYFEDISSEIKEKMDYLVPTFFEGNVTHKPSQIVLVLPDGKIQFIRK